MKWIIQWIEASGDWAPWLFLLLFGAASWLMLWRLEKMNEGGVEGTVLGTLVMPYCSGMGNLIFAFVMGRKGAPGEEVIVNSLVNNVTNLTLCIGLPAAIWGMNVLPASKSKKKKNEAVQARKINRLSMLLTLTAMLFFTGTAWALGRDGQFNLGDGLVLVGLFLFWQCFHVFEVLKTNVRQNKSFTWMLPVNLALLGVGAYGLYVSTDWLVNWASSSSTKFIADNTGLLSGILMVLPNAVLAFYYAWRGNPEVVYTSQIGDGHISIPLCLGVYTLYHSAKIPPFFQTGVLLLVGAATLHFIFVAMLGRIPRIVGVLLTIASLVFLYNVVKK